VSGPLRRPLPATRARSGDLLAAIRSHSPYLAGLLAAADDDSGEPPLPLRERVRVRGSPTLRPWEDAPPPQPSPIKGEGVPGALSEPSNSPDDDEVMRALRRAKNESALNVALADLSGQADVQTTCAALTQFAEDAVGAALRFALRAAEREGRLKLDPSDPERGCGLVVLALGKLGGRELNYSSDVDLIVFYDPQSPAIPPGAAPGPLYVRIVQRLARLLETRTADGYALRVDLRLRPDPSANPVAMSVASAASYYQTLGQNWERAAMIKARPIAGDLALGEAFLKEIAPFVWRKYFDYAAIADIHAMKRQIHAVRGHEAVTVSGHDVKLGRGGIREIEFFVQTQQLIFGGRRPALRGAGTIAMLEALGAEGWVTSLAVQELREAYAFLRAVEHRLQMIGDEQTQRLPVEDVALKRFARFCGYPGLAGFARDLTTHMRAVERHYARLFETAPGLDDADGSLVFTGVVDDPDTLATLARLGFRRPEQATETIRGWHFGRRPALQSARAREVLTELTPALVAAFGGSGDADAALAAFDAMLARMPAAVELMTILRANDSIRELFGDLLGGAPRLAEALALRPHLLDAVIDPARTLADALEPARVKARADAALKSSRDLEDSLDRARDFAAEDRFWIGVRIISGALDPDLAGQAYSALAQSLLSALFARVKAAFAAQYGRGGRVAVLALGKLGSREMTAASDLDLILIYDEAGAATDLAPAVYHARLTQRLVAALTAPTKAGRLYEVDLRLRPSGSQGPLAVSLAAFARYQREEAETWEQMALARARVVAGDADLAAEIETVVSDTLARPRDLARLRRDITQMRALIAREKGEGGPFDLKLAPGGLLDVEFVAQYLVLAHAETEPALLTPETRATLAAATSAGFLTAEDGERLAETHKLLTAVTQTLRLTLPDGADPAEAAAGVRRRIAEAAGSPDFAHLSAALAEARGYARAIFRRLLAR
jgi:glutamate-ammonia-ligase adenylyltransferase